MLTTCPRVPVETRKFEHGKEEDTQRRLANEQAQFRDTQTRVEGDHTKRTEPVVAGEHVHHHVHETIQPVVHKGKSRLFFAVIIQHG